MLYITFTSSPQLYWEHTSCKDLSLEEINFPSLSNLFIWTLGRNSSTWSPVDVAVVNGKYFLYEVASRVGIGERWTGTPLVQPSLRHTLHVGVQENLRYSRKKFKFVLLLNFNNWVFHSAKLCPLC